MSDKNYSTREAAGTLAGTEVMPAWKDGQNVKTTPANIATYVAGAGLALTGSFAGTANLTSSVLTPTVVTATTTMPANCSYLQLVHETVPIAITSLTPVAGKTLVIQHNSGGTANHTVKTAGTFDGANNTATFNAQDETLVLVGLSATRWAIVLNLGSVGLSAT